MSFQNIINQAVIDGVVPGISYAIVTEDTIQCHYVGHLGSLKPFDTMPLNGNYRYELASCSKVIGTTVRILQLIEQGKLAFDQSVQSVLPRFRFAEVTIANLLLHNSGLPGEMQNKYELNAENIVDKIYAVDLIHPVGKVTEYSDIGYILLGFIVEVIDQLGLNDSFQQHIFHPLKMMNTGYIVSDKSLCVPTEVHPKRGLIQGETHDSKGWLLKQGGSSGVFATLTDVSIFVQSFLRCEKFVLSKDTIELLLNTEYGGRTYGWLTTYGKHTLYHTGFTGTSILLDFNRKKGLVLLTNRVHPNRDNQQYLNIRNIINDVFMK